MTINFGDANVWLINTSYNFIIYKKLKPNYRFIDRQASVNCTSGYFSYIIVYSMVTTSFLTKGLTNDDSIIRHQKGLRSLHLWDSLVTTIYNGDKIWTIWWRVIRVTVGHFLWRSLDVHHHLLLVSGIRWRHGDGPIFVTKYLWWWNYVF